MTTPSSAVTRPIGVSCCASVRVAHQMRLQQTSCAISLSCFIVIFPLIPQRLDTDASPQKHPHASSPLDPFHMHTIVLSCQDNILTDVTQVLRVSQHTDGRPFMTSPVALSICRQPQITSGPGCQLRLRPARPIAQPNAFASAQNPWRDSLQPRHCSSHSRGSPELQNQSRSCAIARSLSDSSRLFLFCEPLHDVRPAGEGLVSGQGGQTP